MGVLKRVGVLRVNHYAPLHYLPFIARSRALLSKPSLAANKFGRTHLRSMSSKQDVERGFGRYSFLTLDRSPRILKAKLAAGFPHVAISAVVDDVERTKFSLCRFNVAMTRYLRRNGKPGSPELSTNGRYYDDHLIPIARTDADKAALLGAHLNRTMIEVLIDGDLSLSDETQIICYSTADAEIARHVLRTLKCPWEIHTQSPPGLYGRKPGYVKSISEFVDQALADPKWRGNGLEFDRLR